MPRFASTITPRWGRPHVGDAANRHRFVVAAAMTSKRTFSAPEAFAYGLQALKRAVVPDDRSRPSSNSDVESVPTESASGFHPWVAETSVKTQQRLP